MTASVEVTRPTAPTGATKVALDLLGEATGRDQRHDPVLPRTGGPAGNARLTAWTGVLLLVFGIAELVTLIDVRALISWHLFVGALLVPVALLKTGTTTWRFGRYYAGNRPYRAAGPPPVALRVLGPVVIASTVALLGSGYLLILVGPEASRSSAATVLGQQLDALSLHQAAFVVWAVAVGVHLLARLMPLARILGVRRFVPAGRLHEPGGDRAPAVPGRRRRGVVLAASLVAALLLAAWTVRGGGGWQSEDDFRQGPPAGVESLG